MPTKFLDASIAQKKGATLMMTNQSQASKKDEVASRNEVNNDGLLVHHPIDPEATRRKTGNVKKRIRPFKATTGPKSNCRDDKLYILSILRGY
ncbi:hypothetical protein LSPH24S_06942 [Lysinibacillus sphaericus]